MQGTNSINIRPGVSILSVLRHLNYKPWFAMAEFVDNAIQSFLQNRSELQRMHGDSVKLKVEIELETEGSGRIVIRDNAGGIHEKDYAGAFRAAEVPSDRTGLSEFGMGMKSAACWFARDWSVRTSALREQVERMVCFDITAIVQISQEDLDVTTIVARADAHYTEVILTNLHKVPQGNTIKKIRAHLAGIYRVFLRDGTLDLIFDGTPLVYEEPAILNAPYYKAPEANPVLWRKEIDFDFGEGQKATGFAALREKGSTSGAGFALFRRKRLIQGSADEGYRPEPIFGKSNSYRYQRVFGELHLDGFEVSHTKDGFRWEEHEEVFLEFLKEALDSEPLPLLTQAEEYRVRPPRTDYQPAAEAASDRTAEVVEHDVPPVMEGQVQTPPEQQPPPSELPVPLPAGMASQRQIAIILRGQPWQIFLELTTDPAVGDWLSVGDAAPAHAGSSRRLEVRMSLAHPFMDRFCGVDSVRVEGFLRIAVALALAETTARESGVHMAGTIRRNLNELLRVALSKP
jgi:hypothetical protein